MSSADKQSTSEVESEAEDTRATLASTLDQLRDNLKPAHVAEELVNNARIGASSLVDSVSGLVREHPLPSVLIGAGIAMILGIGARSMGGSSRPGFRGPGDGLASLRPGYRPSANKAKGRKTGGPEFARHMSTGAQGGSGLYSMLQEQPLILAGVGLGLGAMIGAALPITETEDQWLGEASSSFRHAAQEAAEGELGELRAVAGRTADNIKNTVSEHGLSVDNLNELVRDVGDHAKTAVHEVGSTMDPNRLKS